MPLVRTSSSGDIYLMLVVQGLLRVFVVGHLYDTVPLLFELLVCVGKVRVWTSKTVWTSTCSYEKLLKQLVHHIQSMA